MLKTHKYTSPSFSFLAAPRRGKIKPPLQVRSPAEKPGVSKTGVDNAVSRQSKSPAERSRENETHKVTLL